MGNILNCRGELDEEDPDSAWKKQNEDQQNNPLYNLINLKSGGELFNVYKAEKEEGLKKAILKELSVFLYDRHGNTKTITKSEYGQYCDKFDEHEACWHLDKRGGVGETILHLCYLNNTDDHKEVARILINMYPKMVLDIYEGKEYYGESCLHIAIVNGDLTSVQFLVESGARLDQRASGRFFMPEDQKESALLGKNSNYFGYAYYGEYPLHFAACFNNLEIYNYLISKSDESSAGKVDPNAQDSFGNTVLHMLVIHNRVEMYRDVLLHKKMPPDPTITNISGLTPMSLACKLGRNELFQLMLELSGTTFWKFGAIHCVAYPLEDIDSIKENGEHDLASALSIISNSDTDGHLSMLEGGVIYLLLKEKWHIFAKRKFIIRFLLALIHLIVLSVAVYLRPEGDLIGGTDIKDIVRYVAEIMLVINSVIFLGFEIFNMRILKLGYFKSLLHVPGKTLFLFSCILILICSILRAVSSRYFEDVAAIAAVPMAWAYVFFFYRGLEWLGPSVTMIYEMTAGDLFRFSVIWITILSAFSPAFYYLFKDLTYQVETFDTFYGTWMYLYHMTFGEFQALYSGDADEVERNRIPALTKIIFIIFMILVPILLLNMLIAMMTNTFQVIKVRSRKEWQKQWAKIIMAMERSCSKKELSEYQQSYSIEAPKAKPTTREFGSTVDLTEDHHSSTTGNSYASLSDARSMVSQFGNVAKDEKCAGLMIVKPISKDKSVSKPNSRDPATLQVSLTDWKVISRNARHRLAEQGTKGSKATRQAKNPITAALQQGEGHGTSRSDAWRHMMVDDQNKSTASLI
ncbi:transient receptor potential cation channel subfamily V member 5-like isoform X2 [Glandiceps talaboti]